MKFKIAFRNTIKNWRHSLSALLSLSASFVALVLFDGYIDDIKQMYADNFKYRQMLGDVIIENKNLYSKDGLANPWNYWISKSEQEQISAILNEADIKADLQVRNLQIQGMITNGLQSQILLGRGFDVISGEKMRGEHWSWNVTYGKPIDRFESRFVVALGQGLAKKLDCDWERDPNRLTFYGGYEQIDYPFTCPNYDLQVSGTTVDGQLNAVDVQAVSLLDAGYKDIDDRYISTSLEVAQTLMNTDKVTYISAAFNESESTNSKIVSINKKLENVSPDLQAQSWQDHRLGEMFRKTMDFLAIFRNFILVVIVVVSTLSVMNTMIKFVKERTKEIGTMRSIGFTTHDILKIFFLESLFLSFLGTFAGLIFALVFTFMLNSAKILYKAGMLSESVAFKIQYSSYSYLIATILLIVVGTLATFLATRQVVKSKIVDNLNYV